MEEKKITIGGQAVIEGVMMRGPELTATAVRTPEGKIEIAAVQLILLVIDIQY